MVRDAQPGAAGSMAGSPPSVDRRATKEKRVTITPAGAGLLQATRIDANTDRSAGGCTEHRKPYPNPLQHSLERLGLGP